VNKLLSDSEFISIGLSRWEIEQQYLQETYGSPPIVHTYNGESAETYGITQRTAILRWTVGNTGNKKYENYQFSLLEIGDRWMLQPPPPKEEKV